MTKKGKRNTKSKQSDADLKSHKVDDVPDLMESKPVNNEVQQTTIGAVDQETKADQASQSVTSELEVQEHQFQESASPTPPPPHSSSPVNKLVDLTDPPQLSLEQQHIDPESLDGRSVHPETSSKNSDNAKPKKRLTLQERLALAAKGKGKSRDANSPSSSVPPSSQNSNVNSPTLGPVEVVSGTVHPNNEISTNVSNEEYRRLKDKISQLELENLQLTEKISHFSNSSVNVGNDELLKKLAAKDEAIKQLMKEGEALSIKELKLNESIKKLKLKNSELESSLLDYREKSDNATMKLGELEDFLWANNFKTIQQLINKYTDLTNELEETKSMLSQEQSWQKKYTDQERILNNELQKSKDLSVELNDLKVALEIVKQQHDLEIESKNSIIKDLKEEISAGKQLNNEEINRLENKIELLRLEQESVIHRNSPENENKSVDFNEYTKLSENHHNLQQQYLSSQENWKLLESNLLAKIDSLSSSLELLKKSKLKNSNDIKKLNSSLNEMSNKNKQLEEQLELSKNEMQQLKLELEFKQNDFNDLREKSETFKSIYNSDKKNLELKIKTLQETIDIMSRKNSLSPGASLPKLQVDEMHLEFGPKDYIHSSSQEMYEPLSWDIKLTDTPKVPGSHSYFEGSRRPSLNSITEVGEEDLETAPYGDDISTNSRQASFSQSFSNIQNGSSNRNIQMLNKISATSRRLEVEINTLKEENEQLILEKERIQQSLLDKYKLVEEVDELKGQIEVLTLDLEKKEVEHQTMLELIGEKTEQVEELKADVADLKDLCKLQVQQMVGHQ